VLDPSRWLADHGDALWRFAIARVGRADLAEELIQETLVSALETAHGFRGESSEQTWLISILRHKIADSIRRSERASGGAEASVDEDLFDARGAWRVDPGKWPRRPDEVLSDPAFRRDLDSCLSRLPPGLRDAVELREARGIGASVICDELGITERNLWVRLHRARMLLRDCLGRRWAPRHKEGR
jgi:RNA polymerase sigma-70 factor (ECF subfamily)